MQGAGCSEAEGKKLNGSLDVRWQRKDCMHFVEMLSKDRLKRTYVHNLFT